MHNIIPQTVGRVNASIVQYQLFVSFFIVRQVVEQGKWNKHIRIVFSAVNVVHP